MAKKKGFLSPKTFFPKKGDIFENIEEGSSYECMRNHEIVDELSGERILYTILIGRCEELLGNKPIVKLWKKGSKKMLEELQEFDSIHRPKGKDLVRYDRNENGVFAEV